MISNDGGYYYGMRTPSKIFLFSEKVFCPRLLYVHTYVKNNVNVFPQLLRLRITLRLRFRFRPTLTLTLTLKLHCSL